MDPFSSMEISVHPVLAGSFSCVARQQGFGQPAVLKAITQLEDHSGGRLPMRSAHDLTAISTGRSVSFGPFRLFPRERLLKQGGETLSLGGRALDILIALVNRAGEVVTQKDLISHVWPDVTIEEANLRVHIASLRKALGDGRGSTRYIMNVTGRGYTFIAPVTRDNALSATAASIEKTEVGNLPTLSTHVVGRDGDISRMAQQLARCRFLTIVGPGGIGKTTVAIAIADRVRTSYKDGAWLVALASLSDPNLVLSGLCALLGVTSAGVDPFSGLAACLRDKHILIVLDCCEHVIGEAAALAEAILTAAPQVSILATSREPLRAKGEWVHRLAPLQLPTEAEGCPTTAEALGYSALELFNERAIATDNFTLDDTNMPMVLEICRRLDGIPLAIELAAAVAPTLGVEVLAAHLDRRFALLTGGRRTAIPQHQTLRATFDWSHELLLKPERVLLRRLAVFAGQFSLEAAREVAESPELAAREVIKGIANLFAKSLVVAEVEGGNARYRLLDTTRAYALEKLGESGERDQIVLRHAGYYQDLFGRAEAEQEARPTIEWLGEYGWQIDNLRAALDWTFSPDGSASIGIALTAAAVPLWMHLSLVAECRERCHQALLKLQANPMPDLRLRMRLQIGLGNSLLHTRGPSDQAQTVLAQALESAEALGDARAQLRVLLDLASVIGFSGEYTRAAAASERARTIAQQIGDTTGVAFADRRMGMILLRIGRLAEAQPHFERVIQSPFSYQSENQLPIWRHSDDRAMARALLARTLWLRGFPERAHREAQASLGEVRGPNHELTMCRVLLYGMGRIAPMTGDYAAAETAISSIIESATSAAAPFWTMVGQFLRGKLLVERYHFAEGFAVLREAFEIGTQAGWRLSYPEFMGSLALALAGLGRTDEAHDAVCKAIEAAGEREDGEQWYVPELLRIKGEVLLRQTSNQAVEAAADCFARSAAMAREQGALSWELRAALGAAHLRVGQQNRAGAVQILQPVYDRFTEGFDTTTDLKAAKAFLDTMC